MDIKRYLGCKYLSHGRNPDEGLDCYGLALCLYRDMGINLPDPLYSDTDTETNNRIMQSLESTIPNVKLEAPEYGCIIAFTVFGEPSHIGIYMGHGEFIHASKLTGVVVDKLYRWQKRVKGFYRVIE